MWKQWDEIDASCEAEAIAITKKQKITPKNVKEYHKAYKDYHTYIEVTNDNLIKK